MDIEILSRRFISLRYPIASRMSRVRGPNSALTEFLKSQGISAANIRSRYEDVQRQEEEARALEELGIEGKPVNNDESDHENDIRPPKGTEFCAKCNTRFTLTIYSKKNEDGYLCVSCSRSGADKKRTGGGDQAARKQRRKIAAALLDKQDIRSGAKSLQTFCVETIAQYIDDIEAFGDIGSINMNRISQIITRYRQLNDQTLKLFLTPDNKTLKLWDCSNLQPNSYHLIASYCPNLEHLVLSMCGQLQNEGLLYMARQLKNLKHLVLEGAFLISQNTWLEVFEILADNGGLESLTITDTHRFDAESLAHLVENFSEAKTTLERLKLSRLSGLKDADAMYMLAELRGIRHLSLLYMEPEAVSDDAFSTVIRQLAPQLETLELDGCSSLTDETITAIEQCTSITKLSLSRLDQISNEAIARLFDNPSVSRLHYLNLSRCTGLGDEAVRNALVHSAPTLVELNLNSLQMVTTEVLLELLPRCQNLTSINLGFVRCVNNKVVRSLDDSNKHLRLIEVYGVPSVTWDTQQALLVGKQNITVN